MPSSYISKFYYCVSGFTDAPAGGRDHCSYAYTTDAKKNWVVYPMDVYKVNSCVEPKQLKLAVSMKIFVQ